MQTHGEVEPQWPVLQLREPFARAARLSSVPPKSVHVGFEPVPKRMVSCRNSQFLVCASRRRAAPRSQFVVVAASGDERVGQAVATRTRSMQAKRPSARKAASVARCCTACGKASSAASSTIRRSQPNHSVEQTAHGGRQLWLLHAE